MDKIGSAGTYAFDIFFLFFPRMHHSSLQITPHHLASNLMLGEKDRSLSVMMNRGFEESMNIDIGKPLLLLRGHFLDHISSAQKEFNARGTVTPIQLKAFQSNLQLSTPKLCEVLN